MSAFKAGFGWLDLLWCGMLMHLHLKAVNDFRF